MLHRVDELLNQTVRAVDDECGTLSDILFEDDAWDVRYIVIDTADWLPGRKVIIPPQQLDLDQLARGEIRVQVTREQIEGSPLLETDEPVSRQHELHLHGYYRWQPYWVDDEPGGGRPELIPSEELPEESSFALAEEEVDPVGNPNLRSRDEIVGYKLEGVDKEIGEVEDIVIDDETWMVQYLIARLESEREESRKLISVDWVERVEWDETSVYVDLAAGEVAESPEYIPGMTIDRPFEEALHGHFGRARYWTQPSSGERSGAGTAGTDIS